MYIRSLPGVSDELWCLPVPNRGSRSVSWRQVSAPAGYPPGPRSGHCLWAIDDLTLAVFGGEAEEGGQVLEEDEEVSKKATPDYIYLLDLKFMFWSRIFVIGMPPLGFKILCSSGYLREEGQGQ